MHKNPISLMNDFLFKETFTHKDNRKQLKTLIELFLELPKDYLQDKVLDVRYEDALSKDHYHEKSVRGDITITFDDTSINLEAYTTFDKNSLNKSAYYIMRIHVGKLHRGTPYLNLGKTVQINFVDQVKMDLGDHLITNFYLTSEYDLNTKLIPESFCIKIIQIDKLKELGYNETEVKWLKFIAAKDQEERAQIAKGDEELVELNDWIDKYVNDEETKWKMAEWADEIAENKGYEKSIKEEKTEIAKNLLSMNMPLEDIHKATGMEIEEIIKLKEEK